MGGPSTETSMSCRARLGKSRQRSLVKILFNVEKERSTVAVPSGRRRRSLNAEEKDGNIVFFSDIVANS